MAKVKFMDLEDLVDKEALVSAWMEISQDRITKFAELTGDNNPIHLDPQVAKAAGFEGTIVHGYLLLSLVPAMLEQCIEVPREGVVINREGEWKFRKPVLSGDSVRIRVRVESFRKSQERTRISMGIQMEIQRTEDIAWSGSFVFLHIAQTE